MDDPQPVERSHTFIIGVIVALAFVAAVFLWLGSRGGMSPEAREISRVERERDTEVRPLTPEELAEINRILSERVTAEAALAAQEQAEIDQIGGERLILEREF